jgi:hypothetical protein
MQSNLRASILQGPQSRYVIMLDCIVDHHRGAIKPSTLDERKDDAIMPAPQPEIIRDPQWYFPCG